MIQVFLKSRFPRELMAMKLLIFPMFILTFKSTALGSKHVSPCLDYALVL